jgi:hypothetical protein
VELFGSHREYGHLAWEFLGPRPPIVAEGPYVKPDQPFFDEARDLFPQQQGLWYAISSFTFFFMLFLL